MHRKPLYRMCKWVTWSRKTIPSSWGASVAGSSKEGDYEGTTSDHVLRTFRSWTFDILLDLFAGNSMTGCYNILGTKSGLCRFFVQSVQRISIRGMFVKPRLVQQNVMLQTCETRWKTYDMLPSTPLLSPQNYKWNKYVILLFHVTKSFVH